jgi:hypothetical protein
MVVLVEEAGAVVDVPDVEGFTPFHRAVDNGCLDACKVLIALGADVRLETGYKEWGYEMSLVNDDPQLNNLIEKALCASGPYPLEAEDDEASLEEKLEAQRRARDEGGEAAVLALLEEENSAAGQLRAVCRKRERRRRAFRNYKKGLLQPGQMPVPGAAAAQRREAEEREKAVQVRLAARLQDNLTALRKATRFEFPPPPEREKDAAAGAGLTKAPGGSPSAARARRSGRGGHRGHGRKGQETGGLVAGGSGGSRLKTGGQATGSRRESRDALALEHSRNECAPASRRDSETDSWETGVVGAGAGAAG